MMGHITLATSEFDFMLSNMKSPADFQSAASKFVIHHVWLSVLHQPYAAYFFICLLYRINKIIEYVPNVFRPEQIEIQHGQPWTTMVDHELWSIGN